MTPLLPTPDHLVPLLDQAKGPLPRLHRRTPGGALLHALALQVKASTTPPPLAMEATPPSTQKAAPPLGQTRLCERQRPFTTGNHPYTAT